MKNLVALTALLLVLLVVLADTERTSPGPLAAVHALDPRLAEVKNCTVCHGQGERTMDRSCLACHEPIAEQLAAARGLHGGLDADVAADCARCHGEHLGESFAPVRARSFELAGVADRETFDHAGLDWTLSGRHEELGCGSCHANAEVLVLPAGERRYLGLSQTCTACHEDPHEGAYGETCAECHGQESQFELVERFEHPPEYPLLGSHANLACSRCHEPGGVHAVAALLDSAAKRGPPDARDSCRDCHDDPHDAAFLAGVANLVGTTPERSCARCHRAVHETFLGGAEQVPAPLHASTGFPLVAPHADLACRDCHEGFGIDTGEAGRFARAFPGRSRERCEACHRDPHEGQFTRGPFSSGCTECHAVDSFRPTLFGIARHSRTDFPLTGAHGAVGCSECHGTERPIRFADTPSECAACHEDVHRGRFDDQGLPASVSSREGCARCHTTEGFALAADRPFDHGRWTGYVLEGEHAAAACADCHRPTSELLAEGRRFAPVAGTRCDDCHSDVHLGQFAADGATDCARCHAPAESAFTASRFDHQTDSAFPLDEAHRRLECARCHRTYALEGGGNVVRYLPLGRECIDCHEPGTVER